MTFLEVLAGIRTPVLNIIALIFLFPGTEIFFLSVLGVIYWCFNKRIASKIFLSYIAGCIILFIIQFIFRAPMPWLRDTVLEPGPLVSEFFSGYSLPSLQIFLIVTAVVGLIYHSRQRLLYLCCIAVTMLTCFSVMYLGLATWIDVLIALVTGTIVTMLCCKIFDSMLFDSSQNLLYAALMLIPVFILVCVTLSLYFNQIIVFESMVQAINSCGLYIGFIASWYIESAFIGFSVRTDRLWKQIVKAVSGIAILLVIKTCLTIIFSLINGFWISGFICNLAAVICAFGIYPHFIKKYFQARYSTHA